MNRNSEFIPVTIDTCQELAPLWGRFARLSPADADLVSQFKLAPGAELSLSFALGGREFCAIRARVRRAARDREGYYNYFLVFPDPVQAAALRAAVIGRLPAPH